MKGSWRTTLGGTLTAAGAALMGVGLFDWVKPDHKYCLQLSGFLLSVIGPLLHGLFARDNIVSSEQVGALRKVESPNPSKLMPLAVALGLTGAVALMGTATSGCSTTNAGGRLLAATAQTVDGAMQGWGYWVAAGHATPEGEARVRHAYQVYQHAEAAAEAAYLVAVRTGDPDPWTKAKVALQKSARELVRLVEDISAPAKP